jgi:hypothetical protein
MIADNDLTSQRHHRGQRLPVTYKLSEIYNNTYWTRLDWGNRADVTTQKALAVLLIGFW